MITVAATQQDPTPPAEGAYEVLAAARARRVPALCPSGFSEAAGRFYHELPAALATTSAEVWRQLMTAPPASGHTVFPPLNGAADDVSLSVPQGDKPLGETAEGHRISVAQGERTRLVIHSSAKSEQALWLHVAMSLAMTGLDSPVAAIRVFQDGGDEHLAVRFREAGLVVGKTTRLGLTSPSAPMLLSVGIVGGALIAYLNGVPIHARPAPVNAANGFVVDFIGASAETGGTAIHALAVQEGGAAPFWLSPPDAAMLAEADLAAGFDLPPEAQEEALFVRADLPGALPAERVRERILRNREARPYRPDLDDRLVARLGGPASIPPARPRPVVRVRDATVSLHSNPGGSHTFRWRSPQPAATHVVDGVSFDAYAGDIIGILGRNGAGKSTFLKTIVGAMPLSKGQIDIDGKAVLLRPGAGMQPNLTGRENIIKSGLHMDLTPAQITAMIPGIVDVAELGEHIDRPFKYYSDGMRSRLIFSMATAMPYDILLLDELLSAGDIGFQKRATERLDQVIRSAKVVFVVQHTFDFVLTRCTKCLVLERGKPIFFGHPRIAAEIYREQVTG